MNRIHQPNYGGISFPAFSIPLDKPRVFQFSAGAAERFRKLHGYEVTEFQARTEKADFETIKNTFADLVWCAIGDKDRSELSIEDVRRLMTLGAMIKGVSHLVATVDNPGARN